MGPKRLESRNPVGEELPEARHGVDKPNSVFSAEAEEATISLSDLPVPLLVEG